MTFSKSLQVQVSPKLESFYVLKNGNSGRWERHPEQARLRDLALFWEMYVTILRKWSHLWPEYLV